MEGDPEIIKGMVFPYDEKVNLKHIRESLEELAKEKLINWYQIEDNLYIQFPNFTSYQALRKDRVYRSDYPSPSDLSGHDTTSPDSDGQRHDTSSLAPAPAEGKGKVSEGEGEGEGKEKEDGQKILKQLFGEKVLLTLEQYEKLVKENGVQETNQMISILDNWYLTKGKNPNKSDYHTMVGAGWVIKRFNEDQCKQGGQAFKSKGNQSNRPRSFDAIDQWVAMTEGVDEND